MVTVSVTAEAFAAIEATLPKAPDRSPTAAIKRAIEQDPFPRAPRLTRALGPGEARSGSGGEANERQPLPKTPPPARGGKRARR